MLNHLFFINIKILHNSYEFYSFLLNTLQELKHDDINEMVEMECKCFTILKVVKDKEGFRTVRWLEIGLMKISI